MKNEHVTYDSLIHLLSHKYCVLAGAGISYPTPSNLPTAKSIIEVIIKSLPIKKDDQSELISSTSSDWDKSWGIFDCLRFEQLMEAIWWSFNDKEDFIQYMLPLTVPNNYHFQIAQLIANGIIVLTTNFDCLIEQACEKLCIPYSLIASDREYKEYLKEPSKFPNPILKLHGTLAKQMTNSKHIDIAATFESVVIQRTAHQTKWKVVDKLFAKLPLLVIGYSGYDDFDVLPAIRFAPGNKNLIWFQHSGTSRLSVWNALEKEFPQELQVENRLRWFFGRMFGSLNYMGRVKRHKDKVFMASGSTEKLLNYLSQNSTVEAQNRLRRFFDRMIGSMNYRGRFKRDKGKIFVASGSAENHINYPSQKSTDKIKISDQGIDSFESMKLLEEYAKKEFGKKTPYLYLFVGRLFSYLGDYSTAIKYFELALNDAENYKDDILIGRIHAALANIWNERDERYKAHIHMVKARTNFIKDSQLHLKDVNDLIDFSVLLGVDPFTTERPLYFKTIKESTLEHYQSLYQRKKTVLDGLTKAEMYNFEESLSLVYSTFKNHFDSYNIEEQADLWFNILCIERAWNLQEVKLDMRTDREDGAWMDSEADKNNFLLSEIIETYDLLQKKAKLAHAFLMQAEEYMWTVKPDWALERVSFALNLYTRIGNSKGINNCNNLMQHIESIKKGITGSIFYRRKDDNPHEVFYIEELLDIDSINFFCPNCLKMVETRLATCTECGKFLRNLHAPITKKDSEMSNSEKAKLSLTLLTREIKYLQN